MKPRILFTIIIFLIFTIMSADLHSQAGYSPKIDSVIGLCTNPILSKIVRELSGDTSTIIGGGTLYLIVTTQQQ